MTNFSSSVPVKETIQKKGTHVKKKIFRNWRSQTEKITFWQVPNIISTRAKIYFWGTICAIWRFNKYNNHHCFIMTMVFFLCRVGSLLLNTVLQIPSVTGRELCLRLSAHKQPPDGVIHSPGCVSEISKKEERTDLGQKVSDKSVKWTPTKTAHTACLYFYRKAKELKPASLTVTSRGTRVTQSVLGTLCSLMIVHHKRSSCALCVKEALPSGFK